MTTSTLTEWPVDEFIASPTPLRDPLSALGSQGGRDLARNLRFLAPTHYLTQISDVLGEDVDANETPW